MKKNRKPAFFSRPFAISGIARKKRWKNSHARHGGGNAMVDSIYYGGPSVLKSRDGVKIVASKKICFDEPRIV